MVEDGQQTELEALKETRDEADEAYRQGKELEKQRTVLLPQLNAKRDYLAAKMKPLQQQATDVEEARRKIINGELTDYRLRKPRRKKVEP